MKKNKISDTVKFALKFFSSPRRTGSLMPSSRFLARRMVKGAMLKKDMIVVELGPGTGPVTERIIEAGIAPEQIYSIEFDEKLCACLKRRFPNINVINASAEDIAKIMADKKDKVCAVISSLPLVSLPESVAKKILNETENFLSSGGRFVQFTYKLNRSPNELGFTKMKHVGKSKVFRNFPPARVDVFEKV